MAEDKFEQAVIEKLKQEGWEYLTDYSGVTVDSKVIIESAKQLLGGKHE